MTKTAIVTVMKRAGHDVRESDPFEPAHALRTLPRTLPRTRVPIVDRLHSLWESMREPVIAAFPTAPGLPKDTEAYLACVDDLYRSDAYHSLSIEGYRVNVELIERVRTGERLCEFACDCGWGGRRSTGCRKGPPRTGPLRCDDVLSSWCLRHLLHLRRLVSNVSQVGGGSR